MRVLRLDVDGSRFELHPYVSVLTNIDTAHRARVLQILTGLPSGRVTEARGLVEAHGVLLDLAPDTLALLDLGLDVGSDGSTGPGIDAVVRADQLPGAALGPGARERAQLIGQRDTLLDAVNRAQGDARRAQLAHAANREALDELDEGGQPAGLSLDEPRHAIEQHRAAREAMERSLEEARAALTSAEQDLRAAAEELDGARLEYNELARAASQASAALEDVRTGRDPFAAAALDAADERVAELERELADDDTDHITAPEGNVDPAALEARIAALEVTRQTLEASLLSLDATDPYAVEVALAQVEHDDDVRDVVPSADAQALADEWVALQSRLQVDAAFTSDDPAALVAARKRLDGARVGLFEAEKAVRLPDVSREDAQALEDAHEAVLRAQDKLDKRFAGGKARTRLDEARHAEQEILDRLGFLTYMDFVMGTSILNVDPIKERGLDEARAALAAAEAGLAALEAGVDAELLRAELRSQQKVLRARAVEVLGRDPGDDVEWSLRQMRVEAGADNGRFDRLAQALEAAGVVLGGEDTSGELLIEMARVWLDEQGQTAAQRSRIESELASNDAELAGARAAAADRAGAASDRAERRRRVEARLVEARDAVAAAEGRVERHAAAEIQVAQAKIELEGAAAAEERWSAGLAPLEQAVTVAADRGHHRAVELAEAEAALAQAAAAEQQAVDVLAALEEQLAQTSQLSDRRAREAAAAAAAAGAEAAALVLEEARAGLATVDARLAELPAAESDGADQDASAAELEWYLLSRVAAQRSVSYAGSVPFVLDDIFSGVPGEALEHLLDRLERMASAVQVVILSDDAPVAYWAQHVGPDRAAIVQPEPIA